MIRYNLQLCNTHKKLNDPNAAYRKLQFKVISSSNESVPREKQPSSQRDVDGVCDKSLRIMLDFAHVLPPLWLNQLSIVKSGPYQPVPTCCH